MCLSARLPRRACLPAQAIDLIDEAGSRVRLRHIQLPEEARELDKELKQVGGLSLTCHAAFRLGQQG